MELNKHYSVDLDEFQDESEPEKPLSEVSIRLINSIINSRVPEENFYRDDSEE